MKRWVNLKTWCVVLMVISIATVEAVERATWERAMRKRSTRQLPPDLTDAEAHVIQANASQLIASRGPNGN